MIIRSKQMEVFESAAEEDFVQRLTTHLLESYANSVVRLPDQESSVDKLPKETLELLVGRSIEHARSYDLSFESSISAFSAIMFDVAPNFDKYGMCQLCLKDENIEPNARISELLKLLSETHWEKIRTDYDVKAWFANGENTQESAKTDASEKTVSPETVKNQAFAETVMSVAKPRATAVKNTDFAETAKSIERPKKSEQPKHPAAEPDFDFSQAVFNIDLTKE